MQLYPDVSLLLLVIIGLHSTGYDAKVYSKFAQLTTHHSGYTQNIKMKTAVLFYMKKCLKYRQDFPNAYIYLVYTGQYAAPVNFCYWQTSPKSRTK